MTGDFQHCEGCELVYLAQDCEQHYEGRFVVLTCPVCASVTTKLGAEGDDLAVLDYLVTL